MNDERLINVKEVARLTSTSTRTIHRWHDAGRIPQGMKISGCLRWRLSDVRIWIDWNCCSRTEFEARKGVAHAS